MKRKIDNKMKVYHGIQLHLLQKILREKEMKLPKGKGQIILLKSFEHALEYSNIVLEIDFNPYSDPSNNDFEVCHDSIKVRNAIPLKDIRLVSKYQVSHNEKIGPYSSNWRSQFQVIKATRLIDIVATSQYGNMIVKLLDA